MRPNPNARRTEQQPRRQGEEREDGLASTIPHQEASTVITDYFRMATLITSKLN